MELGISILDIEGPSHLDHALPPSYFLETPQSTLHLHKEVPVQIENLHFDILWNTYSSCVGLTYCPQPQFRQKQPLPSLTTLSPPAHTHRGSNI